MGEKINPVRLNIIGLIIFIVGLSFIGFGITGKAISISNSDYCSLDIECSNGKICCITSGAIGMCQTQEICNELKADVDKEIPLNSGSSLLVGVNLVIFAAILFVISYMAYKSEMKRKTGRAVRRNFRRR